MNLCKTSDFWGRAIFDPKAVIWTILVQVCWIKLHTKYHASVPLVLDKKIFKDVFFYMSLCKTSDPQGQGHFWPQIYDSNNLGRGPLDVATYQIGKALPFWFLTRFFKIFSNFPFLLTQQPVLHGMEFFEPLWKRITQRSFLTCLIRIHLVV